MKILIKFQQNKKKNEKKSCQNKSKKKKKGFVKYKNEKENLE